MQALCTLSRCNHLVLGARLPGVSFHTAPHVTPVTLVTPSVNSKCYKCYAPLGSENQAGLDGGLVIADGRVRAPVSGCSPLAAPESSSIRFIKPNRYSPRKMMILIAY